MKHIVVFLWLSALIGTSVAQTSDSTAVFWEKFKTAVFKGDKNAVASLSQFPIGMPYGVPDVRNRAQLIKRYRFIFSGETDARQCFREKQPEINPQNASEFSVGCKNAAGDEVVIYWFKRTRSGWKFTALDNINE